MGCGGSTAVRPADRPTIETLRAKHGGDSEASINDPDAAAPGGKYLRSGASLKKLLENNAVLVVTRVRPLNDKEAGSAECISVTSSSQLTIDGRPFTYDAVFRPDAVIC